jgi:hypothetical protein
MRVNDNLFMSGTLYTHERWTRKIGTGPKACFCLGFLLWGIWLQGLLLSRSLASPQQSWPSPSPALSVPKVNTARVNDEALQLPPPTTLVTIYEHNPHMYHWQRDCPNIINPVAKELRSAVLHTMTCAQAEAQGIDPCPFGGDPDAQQQVRKIRSEVTNNRVSLRPRT